MAERVSLSPNLISFLLSVPLAFWMLFPQLTDTANVSFSLTIGMTFMLRSSTKVFWALMYCVRCYPSAEDWAEALFSPALTSAMSFRVRSIWAIGWRMWSNRPSQRLLSRHCPTAASACHLIQLAPLSSSAQGTNLYSRHVLWLFHHVHSSKT